MPKSNNYHADVRWRMKINEEFENEKSEFINNKNQLNLSKMAINATSGGSTQRELIPAGNYIARCYKMIHIGTIEEIILGEKKKIGRAHV